MLTFAPKFKAIFLIFIGSLIWSVTMVKSGLWYSFGLGFWGPNGHDGVWHLSLIESLSQGSFTMPLFAGAPIQNYHLGFDFLMAILHRLTFIPVSWLYFQVLPPLIALFIGYFVYKLILTWTKSESAALWSVFFTYFGSSFGWIVTLFRNRSLGGESIFWSQQAISTLINPPLALSFCLLLLGLWLLQTRRLIWAALVFGLIPTIKIYGGVLGYVGLFFMCLKDKIYWKTLLISAVLGAALFIPINAHSTGLIVWHPLWFLQNLMNQDHLNWPKYFSALDTYTVGHVWIKAIPAFSIALVIFLLGNLSFRVLALRSLNHPKHLTWWQLFLWSAAIAGIIPPLFFLQQGTAWNTIQFFYYSQFFLGILAGVGIAKIKPHWLLSFLIVALTLPGTIGTLPNYLPARPPAKLPPEEIIALTYLSNQPEGIVLTIPYDGAAAAAAIPNPPRPLYLYESTSYVSAYSHHPVFLEDQVNLNITGYPWEKRRTSVLNFFSHPTREFLTSNRIRYIYLVGTVRPPLPDHISALNRIFTNSQVDIYRVD